LSHALHPRQLETLPPSGSLRQLIDDYSDTTGFMSSWSSGMCQRSLYHRWQSACSVSYQSLSNIAKHAQASTVLVTLTGTPGAVQLVVKNNGKGFDPERKEEKRQGIGLVSMQERVRHSRPKEGTTVVHLAAA
jgi:two-component system, NarL family, sensor kinase